jgi:uncharacterized protein
VYNTKYNNVIKFDSENEEEVKEFIVSADDSNFVDMGFVVENNELEREKKNYLSIKKAEEKLNIMIIMTYNCNCSCQYCFENLDVNMERENVDKTVEYIINEYKRGYKELEINFFGGEPMLRVDEMVNIYQKLLLEGIKVKAVVITNGVLLSLKNIIKLKSVGINHFQITVDGPKELHDARRPCKNGDSCWDEIMKNLSFLKKEEANISIRININGENVGYLEEICFWVDSILDKYDKYLIYIAPVVGCVEKTVKETLKNRTETLKRAWKIIKEKSLPIRIAPPVYAPCPYHSEKSAYYIDLSGNIYTCGGFVGERDKIDRTYNMENDRNKKRIEFMPLDSCFECTFFPVCMGGCKFEESKFKQNCQYSYLKDVYDEYFAKYAD